MYITTDSPVSEFISNINKKFEQRKQPRAERRATVDATEIKIKTNKQKQQQKQKTNSQNTYSNKKKLYNHFTALITRSLIPDS